MCLPAIAIPIIAGISAATSAAGVTIGAVGAANAGASASEQGRRNAARAESAAVDVTNQAAVGAGQLRSQASQVTGAQRAAYGASGVDVASGSPAQVAAETRATAEVDVDRLKLNAAREAWGYRQQGADYLERGRQGAAAGTAQAVGSILGGVGSTAAGAMDTYAKYKAAKAGKYG